MSELKKCEHCGGTVTLEVIDGRACIDDPTCERRHWEADAPCRYQGVDGLVEWWNTRAERTCEMSAIPSGEQAEYDCYEVIWHCQSCHIECALYAFNEDGDVWAERPNYCPNCGARLVVE